MRLFVALDLPWPLPQRLGALMQGLPGARFVPLDNIHLTLRFVGELARYQADELDLALGAVRAPGFDLVLAGVGVFPAGDRAGSLWAGVAPNPALQHLRAKIDTAVQRAGIAVERRRFTPHVTLARLDATLARPGATLARPGATLARPDATLARPGATAEPGLARWLHARNLFETEPVRIRAFTLFSSQRGKEQSVYTPEVEYALQ